MLDVRRGLAVVVFAVMSQVAVGQVSMTIQMSTPETPVTGLPFSAEQSVHMVQHLANGVALKSEVKGHVYRSTAGVERYEGVMPVTDPTRPEPTTMIYILDRTKHTSVLLNTKLKTATVEHLPATATVAIQFLQLPRPRVPNQPAKKDSVVTDLGTRMQGLLSLKGKRSTGTIAAGAMGNDAPLYITTDVWVAPSLKLIVNQVEQNPLVGERTYELTNIRGDEPDAALFEIPEGYTVKDKPPMGSLMPSLPPTAEQRVKQIPDALKSTDPRFKNSVAYALANKKDHLAEAQTLAEEAVALAEQETADVVGKGAADAGFKQTAMLTSYWDTLGWVYYRQGKMEQAAVYLVAAWSVKPNPEIGLHLGSLYEAQQRPKDAAMVYRMALSGKNSPIWEDDFKTRLAKLGEAQAEPVSMVVTTTLPSLKMHFEVEPLVEIQIGHAGSPAVAYLEGEPLHPKPVTEAIQKALAQSLPDSGPEIIVRRAHVSCAERCELRFVTP